MDLITAVEPFPVHVERVGIFHDELAQAQQSRFRARLVPEFGLDLVPDLRQILVGSDLLAGDVGKDLLVGHAQAKVASSSILQAKHVLAHVLPAPGFLPEGGGMQGRQEKFLGGRGIQLFANDAGDFEHRALSQGQVRINAGRDLTNESAPNQQLVRWELCVRGIFPQRGDKGSGPAHSVLLRKVTQF